MIVVAEVIEDDVKILAEIYKRKGHLIVREAKMVIEEGEVTGILTLVVEET